MRPVIDGELEAIVLEAVEVGGYQNQTEFVRDAVRQRAEEVLDHE